MAQLDQTWVLGKEIASGGFARVYEAHSVLESDIAAVLKLIPNVAGSDRELLFEDLPTDSNIMPILDMGEWRDDLAIVMPQADKSLRDELNEKEGILSLEDALDVLSSLAEALVSIESNVVHRDVKPENILYLRGRWVLADFGIARYVSAATAPDTRKFAMSPPYAAPEQWRHERATNSTDVYAAGIVAFELLSGRRPFLGPHVDDFRRQHLEDIPPRVENAPAALAQLISECLLKAPQARPKPQNMLARLRSAKAPLSEAARRLQEAYGKQVGRRAEEARYASLAQTRAERRASLFASASPGIAELAAMLRTAIEMSAPGSSGQEGLPWTAHLGEATLRIESGREVNQRSDSRYSPPFEVIAHSRIQLQIPPDHWKYEGRSHSLWYCDAQHEGVFRWYETAFMISPLISRQGRMDPFALDPLKDAFGAILPVMTEYQVAWPFTPVDQGEEAEFIERWIGWLAGAAEGTLRHPSSMPERKPLGSWRTSSS